ncbi:MAG: ribosome biogenesis GTPase YlqF [Bdellovibrionales bacterium]|nr:ribosome biogenesis GTPase YlqF [Bdellovibrionales bacterium]
MINHNRKDVGAPPDKAVFNWYPGHMAKALRQIKEKLKTVDIVLEIRDARVPLISGNKALDATLGNKSRLILLNKVNLADPLMVKEWHAWFTAQGVPFIFANCFEKNELKKVINLARKIVEGKRLECNPEMTDQKAKLRLMVIGLPNTGKSTIINQLANKSATKVADKPGQTQMQQWITIDKDLELLDTPGVMPPNIEKEEHGLWLCAIHAIPDSIVGEEMPALFLIKHLLKAQSSDFKERYKLESFEISLDEAVVQIAKARGCLKQKGLPDLDRVYKLILQDFRKGELGKYCFGTPPKATR